MITTCKTCTRPYDRLCRILMRSKNINHNNMKFHCSYYFDNSMVVKTPPHREGFQYSLF